LYVCFYHFLCVLFFFFFFQAEDGIRDDLVTGVQTCALPISLIRSTAATPVPPDGRISRTTLRIRSPARYPRPNRRRPLSTGAARSEERRVGKECRSRWSR